ncbi:MAG: MFS transporter, partial [Methylocystis sp.]
LAGFLIAVPVSSAIGSPISGLILAAMDGVGGISGWRWLFLMEALPSIILGFVCFFYLPDGPESAAWLTHGEKAALRDALEKEAGRDHGDHWRALTDRRVLILGVAYFGIVIALYGLSFWLPQIIKSFGFGVVATSLLASIPYVCSAFAMWAWSRSSDRRGETVGHTALAGIVGAVGLACAAYAPTPSLSMIALSVAAIGAIAALPTFWSFATLALGSGDGVVGVAVINSIGNVSGFAGPYLVGVIKGATGEFSDALLALSLGPLVTALLIRRIAAVRSPRA